MSGKMNAHLSWAIKDANVLMTLLIVMMHTTWADARFAPLRIVTDAAVPTFFCISSFLYFYKWRQRRSTLHFWIENIKSRVRSLAVPYLLYNTIYYFYYLAKTHLLHLPTDKLIPTDPLGAAVCILSSVPDGVLWYVRALMLFAIVAPAMGLLVERSRWGTIAIAGVGVVLGCTHLAGYEQLWFWLPCLAAGCHAALWQKECAGWLCHIRRQPLWLILVCVAAYTVSAVQAFAHTDYSYLPGYYLWRISTPLLLLMVYNKIAIPTSIAPGAPKVRGILPERLTAWLAPMAFFIYCNHSVCIHAAKRIATAMVPESMLLPHYIVLLAATLAIVVLMALAAGCIKPLWRLLNGGRGN